MNLIVELPHANYNKKGITAIDFRLEKMPLSTKDKKKFANAFFHGKGIIGLMPKTNKYLLFTPNNIKVLKDEPKDKTLILPPDWQKYALILRDWKKPINEKERLKKIINSLIHEIIIDK